MLLQEALQELFQEALEFLMKKIQHFYNRSAFTRSAYEHEDFLEKQSQMSPLQKKKRKEKVTFEDFILSYDQSLGNIFNIYYKARTSSICLTYITF